MKLVDMTITQFTDTLASDAPAPGGGSVAALCGAQAAALVAMVCRLTIGKPKYAEFEENCKAVLEKAEALKEKLIHQIDEDTEAYNKVSAAFKLPKAEEEEKKARSAAIQEATIYATEVPYNTMVMAKEVLELAQAIDGKSNPNTASDLGVAVSCAKTAIKGGHLNVLINTPGIKNAEIKEKFENDAAVIGKLAE